MKTSKKLVAFAICLVMLAMLVPMSALATGETLTIGTITKSAVASDLITITVPYTAENVEQVTILAARGGDTEPTTYDSNNIAYIDQQAAETNITVGESTFTGFQFVVDYTKFNATTNKLYIKMGGTALGTAAKAENPVIVVEAVTSYKVFGYVNVTEVPKVPITVTLAQGLIASTDATGKFEITGANPGTYDLVISAKSALPRTIPVTITNADAEVSVDANKIPLFFGDTDGSGGIVFADLVAIKTAYNKKSGDDGYDVNCDLNNNGTVEFADLVTVKSNYNKTSYDTWTK